LIGVILLGILFPA